MFVPLTVVKSYIWIISYNELRMWNRVSFDPRSYERNLYNYIYRSLKTSDQPRSQGLLWFQDGGLGRRRPWHTPSYRPRNTPGIVEYFVTWHTIEFRFRYTWSTFITASIKALILDLNTVIASPKRIVSPQKISVFDMSDMFPFSYFPQRPFSFQVFIQAY